MTIVGEIKRKEKDRKRKAKYVKVVNSWLVAKYKKIECNYNNKKKSLKKQLWPLSSEIQSKRQQASNIFNGERQSYASVSVER